MRRISFLILVVFGCLAPVPWLHAQGDITTFDAPSAGTGPGQGTLPQQITAAGTIVGYYRDANRVRHGFVRSAQGEFTTFDVPGAGTGRGQGTQALGMTQATVVGTYIDANQVSHGFVRGPDGKLATFDAPGAGTGAGQGTTAASINAAGTVSGLYVDTNGVGHGFVRAANGTIASFDPAGSVFTSALTLGIIRLAQSPYNILIQASSVTAQ